MANDNDLLFGNKKNNKIRNWFCVFVKFDPKLINQKSIM